MAGEPLVEELALDISPALDSLGELSNALTEIASEFANSLSDAIAGLTDVTAAPIDLTANTDSLDASIADALDAPRPPIDIEADTSTIESSINDAVTQTAGNIQPIDIPVTADTSDAVTQIDDLGAAADNAVGAPGGSSGGGSGLEGMAEAGALVGAATGAATGEVGGLTEVVGGLSTGIGGAVAAGVAFTAFLGETVSLAANAQAQQARFNDVFGQTAEAVQHINIGGLNISLDDLATKSGTALAALQSSASRIGQLGFGAGAAASQVAETTDKVLALAGATSVANPALGDTATVADRLTRLLATGGQRLAQYGISLSSAQINAEGLKLGLGDANGALTPFDKLVAGSTLAVAQLGDSIGTKFAAGLQNAQVQLRSIKVQLEETLVAIGGPLLQPVTQSLQAVLPVAEEVGKVLGDFAVDLAPAFEAAAGAIGLLQFPLEAIDGILHDLGPGGVSAALAIVGLAKAFTLLNTAIESGAVADFLSGGAVAALGSIPPAAIVAGAGIVSFEGTLHALNAIFPVTKVNVQQLTSELDNIGTSNSKASLSDLHVSITQLSNDIGQGNDSLGRRVSDLFHIGFGGETDIQNIKQANTDIKGFNDSLVALVNNGQLSQANIAFSKIAKALFDQGVSTTQIGQAFHPYLQAMADAQKANEATTTAATEQTFANFKQSSSYGDLTKSIQAGSVVLGDAAAQAKIYNITQDQATQIITDVEAAMDKNAEATFKGSQAQQQLIQQLQAGNITIPDATAKLVGMHFSADGAAAAVKQLSSDLTSFVSKIDGALPSFGDAQKAFDKLGKAPDAAHFGQELIKQAEAIAGFQANLIKLAQEGAPELAAQFAQEGPAVGAAAAAGIASSANLAKSTEAALRLKDAAVKTYDNTIGPGLLIASEGGGKAAASGFAIAAKAGQPQFADAAKTIVTGFTGVFSGALSDPGSGVAAKTNDAISATSATLSTLSGVSQLSASAHAIGFNIGIQLDFGMSAGIQNSTIEVATSAAAMAAAAEAAAKKALGILSPSKVAFDIGTNFGAGLGLGITGSTNTVVGATSGLAQATIQQLQDELDAFANQASSTSSSSSAPTALSSVVQSIVGQLPGTSTTLSKYTQDIATATSKASEELSGYHKASATYVQDQKTESDLLKKKKDIQDVYNAALANYNAIQLGQGKKASDAQKQALTDARQTLDQARSALDSYNNKFNAAVATTGKALISLTQVAGNLKTANEQLKFLSNPSTFISDLNAQTAASQKFQANIQKLVKEGDTDLAEQLAEAGPATAGKLAQQFANSATLAKTANAAVKHANTFADTFTDTINSLFGDGGSSSTSLQQAGTTAGTAIQEGLTTGINTTGSTSGAVLAKAPAGTALSSGAPTLSSGTVGGTLELDLTIVLQNGETVKAKTTVPVKPGQSTLKQKVTAAVKAG